MHAWCLGSPKEGIESPGTGVTYNCEPNGCRESNQDLLQKQPVFLTAEPSLQHNKNVNKILLK